MTVLGICALWIIPLTSLLLLRAPLRPSVGKVPSWATASQQLAARQRGLQRVQSAPPAHSSHSRQGHFVRAAAPARFGANV